LTAATSACFGATFEPMMAHGDVSEASPQLWYLKQAWAQPLWALMAEGDADTVYEGTRVIQDSIGFNWLPVLLWLFTVFVTVYVVNLMIARMTSTYEHIRSESRGHRAEQELNLALEFKDQRRAPPPFNILAPNRLIRLIRRGQARFLGEKAAKRAGAGFITGMGSVAARRIMLHECALRDASLAKAAARDTKTLDSQINSARAELLDELRREAQQFHQSNLALREQVESLATQVLERLPTANGEAANSRQTEQSRGASGRRRRTGQPKVAYVSL